MKLKQFIQRNWARISEDKHRMSFLIDEHPEIYRRIQTTTGCDRPKRKDVYDLAFARPVCKLCGGLTNWYSRQYADFCSAKCRNDSPEVKATRKASWSKFEGGHPAADPTVRQKIVKKWQANHGVSNPVFLKKTKRALRAYRADKKRVDQATLKRQASCAERYGDLPFRTPSVMEARRQTRIRSAKIGKQSGRERVYPVCIQGEEHWLEGSGAIVALRLAAAGVTKITANYGHYPDIRYTTKDGVEHRYWPDLMFRFRGKIYVVEVKSPYTLGVYKPLPRPKLFEVNLAKFQAAHDSGHKFLLAVVTKNSVRWFANPHKLTYVKVEKTLCSPIADNTHVLMRILCSAAT